VSPSKKGNWEKGGSPQVSLPRPRPLSLHRMQAGRKYLKRKVKGRRRAVQFSGGGEQELKGGGQETSGNVGRGEKGFKRSGKKVGREWQAHSFSNFSSGGRIHWPRLEGNLG